MSTFRVVYWLALCLIASLPATAMRAPLVESAATTAPGTSQLEFSHQLRVAGDTTRTQVETMTFSRGLDRSQQIDITMPWQVEASTGDNALAGDLTTLYKTGQFWSSADGRAAVGGLLRTTAPTSTSSRTGGSNYTFEPGLLFSQIGERSLFSLNATAFVQTRGDEYMRYGASYERAWKSVAWYVEATGTTDFKRNLANESAQASSGLEFLLGERWAIDIGGTKGITGTAPNWAAHTGTTVKF